MSATLPARQRTFNREGWTLWLDRVAIRNGFDWVCTVWRPHHRGGQERFFSCRLADLRAEMEREQ